MLARNMVPGAADTLVPCLMLVQLAPTESAEAIPVALENKFPEITQPFTPANWMISAPFMLVTSVLPVMVMPSTHDAAPLPPPTPQSTHDEPENISFAVMVMTEAVPLPT